MDNLISLLLTALPREQLALFPSSPLQMYVIHLRVARTSGILSFHPPCLHWYSPPSNLCLPAVKVFPSSCPALGTRPASRLSLLVLLQARSWLPLPTQTDPLLH